MFYYWPMYRAFRLMHPYVMKAEDSEREFQKYLKMGVGSRLVGNAIGVPMGVAMGAMLWGTYLSLLVLAYTCFGIINSILILLLVFIYGTLLPIFLITYSIANIILDLLRVFRPHGGNQPHPNGAQWPRHRG